MKLVEEFHCALLTLVGSLCCCTICASKPLTVSQITTGDQYTCALLQTGQVKCWGRAITRLDRSYTRGTSVETMGNNLPDIPLGDEAVEQLAHGSLQSYQAAHMCVIFASKRA